jgi:diguanylate cyclase (GGDEF)-like protein
LTQSGDERGLARTLAAWLSGLSDFELATLGVILVALIAGLDFVTGEELSLSILYMLPVAIVAWWGTRVLGIMTALLATVAWDELEILAGHERGHVSIVVWNSVIRGSFLVVASLLLSALQASYRRESALARIDPLTGLANRRTFIEATSLEIERSRRTGRPFTLAYVDLDRFKEVNDRHGHPAGDAVLRAVAATMSGHARAPDLVGRIGGDELAILLPETDAREAERILASLRSSLLDAMARGEWPTTFSFGAVAFHDMPRGPEDALRMADDLVLDVKRGTKGEISLATCEAGGELQMVSRR